LSVEGLNEMDLTQVDLDAIYCSNPERLIPRLRS
jgi:hypothetical protein